MHAAKLRQGFSDRRQRHVQFHPYGNGGQGRPNRRQRAADRCPVDDDGDLGTRERDDRDARRRGHSVALRAKGESNCDQKRGESGVEAEEFHARVARDEREREHDAEPEVSQKEEENH